MIIPIVFGLAIGYFGAYMLIEIRKYDQLVAIQNKLDRIEKLINKEVESKKPPEIKVWSGPI